MDLNISVKKVKEIYESIFNDKWLTWEEAVAIKCKVMFDVHKILMLKNGTERLQSRHTSND